MKVANRLRRSCVALLLFSLLIDFFMIVGAYRNYNKKIEEIVENKIAADSNSVLPHLYERGNFLHFKAHLDSYKYLGLPCLTVSDFQSGEIIFSEATAPCVQHHLANNYIDQPVLKLSYTIPVIGYFETLASIWEQLAVSFVIKILVCLLIINLAKYMESSERAKIVAETAQMLAHDIQVPFSIMAIFMTKFHGSKPEEVSSLVQSFFPEVERAMALATEMIRDVIEIGKNAKPNLVETDIALLINSTIQDILTIKAREVKLSCDFHHSATVNVDISKIKRVLTNLLLNALDVVEKSGGDIWVRTSDEKGWVRVVVGNTGCPIAQKERARLFDPFYSRGKAQGSGLGLAIVKKFVQVHGGRITCTSNPLGQTEFAFTLPSSSAFAFGRGHREFFAN